MGINLSSSDMAKFTRHGLHGGPRQLYGPFAGKAPEKAVLTRLGLYCGPRRLYGSFAGRTVVPDGLRLRHEGFRRNVGRMMR